MKEWLAKKQQIKELREKLDECNDLVGAARNNLKESLK